jgi:Helicase conserved C-terminal domain.
MVNPRIIILGDVFEFAFKLGFLKGKVKDYESFKEGGFEKIKSKFLDNGLEELAFVWEKLKEHVPFELENPPQGLKNLGLGQTDKNTLLFLFLLGYYEGSFYGKGFKDVKFIKYQLGEGSQIAGIYPNADLLFIADGVLYVVDFKLAGAEGDIKALLDIGQGNIPYRVYGLPVNVSLGEVSFERFVLSLLEMEEELLSLKTANPELKGFLQVASYGVDYMCEEKPKDVREISLSLFYPLAEPFSARFYWNGEDLSPYRERVRQLYEKIKEIDWEYSQAVAENRARRERLLEEVPKEIERLKEEMQKRENTEEIIEPRNIDEARKHVEKELDKFFSKTQDVKALCLLHSAGSGKTTQTRNRILMQEGKHIVLYMATRKVLVDREYKKLKDLKDALEGNGEGIDPQDEEYKVLEYLKKSNKSIGLVYEKRQDRKGRHVKNIGDTYQNLSANSGILNRTVEQIKKLVDKNDIIWALCTQQAVVETQYGKATSEHLNNLASRPITGQYTFHIILDEFLGHSNGLYAIEEMFNFLGKVKEKGGRANLYLFDANGYSPAILKKLLEEYGKFKVVPESLVIVDFKEEEDFKYKNIEVSVRAKHGYPSPKIIVKRKFLSMDEANDKIKEELANRIAGYIKHTFEDRHSQTAFLFLQSKELLAMLKSRLEDEGYSCLIATADSRKSQDRINRGNEDIILSTSALSRGIDLSRPHKPINKIYAIITDFGIESNLVEMIQAISRARGDEKTEKNPKELHFVYPIYPQKDEFFKRILEYEPPEADEKILRLLITKHTLNQKLILDRVVFRIVEQFVKSGKGKVLVPLPSQYATRYIPNEVADIEGFLSFLENIVPLIEDEEKKEKVKELYNTLLSAILVNVVQINFKKEFEYYHPYILFEKQQVRYAFEPKKRGEIKKLFEEVKEILKDHNQEKTDELKSFIKGGLPYTSKIMPTIIPVYALVLTEHFLREKEKVEFKIMGRIGRGKADTLMGSVKPVTRCFVGTLKEYACVPLGEDYPYKEVLSGRFAKFPIDFIMNLLGD